MDVQYTAESSESSADLALQFGSRGTWFCHMSEGEAALRIVHSYWLLEFWWSFLEDNLEDSKADFDHNLCSMCSVRYLGQNFVAA
jgi:hypothetical protein